MRNPLYQEMTAAGFERVGVWDSLDVDAERKRAKVRSQVEVIPFRSPRREDGTILAGRHCVFGDKHTIYLAVSISPELALNTLRHELRHVRQAETIPNFATLYRLADQRLGYDLNPYEQEARRYANSECP